MYSDFTYTLKLLEEKEAKTYLSAGSPELDELLGKSIEPGTFYLFYGNPESNIYLFLERRGCNAQA